MYSVFQIIWYENFSRVDIFDGELLHLGFYIFRVNALILHPKKAIVLERTVF